MQSTLSCFNCEQPIPDKANYYFCSKCFTQLKCKSCNEILEKGDLGCSNCGTPIVQKETNDKAVNSIEFEQKGSNKSFKARFTDTVGENLVASLGGLFLGNGGQRPMQNPFSQSKTTQLPAASLSTKTKNDAGIEDAIIIESTKEELGELLLKIFEVQDDKISLVNSRVKHTGKRDQAIRITLLLLYAYGLTGKKQVKRSEVADILQGAAVYDNNFIGWLSKCDEIKKVEGDLLELNLPGRDAAFEILKEFGNPAIEKGTVHFSGLSAKAAKGRSKKSKGESGGKEEAASTQKSSNSSTKMTPVKMIEILINEGYFQQKRRVPEILKYCKEIKAHTLDTSPLSVALSRMIKNGKMKREKNTADNQYEYYQ